MSERIEVDSESESSSSSDGSREGEGLHANKAPVGPEHGEEGDPSIFAAFQELQTGHSADALVQIEEIRSSTYVESLSYFCGGGLRRGRVMLFVSGRKKRVRFYTIAWSHKLRRIDLLQGATLEVKKFQSGKSALSHSNK